MLLCWFEKFENFFIRIDILERLFVQIINSSSEKEKQVKEHRYNFGKFFQEHDKRRGTDFCKTFPELESFYRECLEIKLW